MRAITAILAIVFSVAACADEHAKAATYQEGVHYAALAKAVPTRQADKIEVVEVFSYVCGHCFRFESLVQQWKLKKAEDVVFQQLPVTWNELMEVHARAFRTAKTMGVLEQVHQPFFNAIHLEKKRLANADEVADLFVASGIDSLDKVKGNVVKACNKAAAKAEMTFASPADEVKHCVSTVFENRAFATQIKQAYDRVQKGYAVTGTPTLIVDGRYRVEAGMAGNHVEMLKVVDFLIEKIRAERG